MGLDMVDPDLKCNLGMCLSMVRIKDVTDVARHETLSKIFVERIGFEYYGIIRAITSNRTAKDIATMLNHDKDACDMHDYDKIGLLAIAYLIRTKNKVQHF